ncbi:MAG: hypothetical protein WC433_08110 [Candidatus Omnitrophota bacterium]|jgi:hypothetical protein
MKWTKEIDEIFKIVPDINNPGFTFLVPKDKLAENMSFSWNDEDEAYLACVAAPIAKRAGMSKPEFEAAFKCILRILKSESEWAK